MMKLGSIGQNVKAIQTALGVPKTGYFDEATDQAVRKFQKAQGLIADGIVGEKTMQALQKGQANPKHLTFANIQHAAQTLDVSTAHVLAINQVESNGNGFLPDGRIKILYERHVMYRLLKQEKFDADSFARQLPNLVNKVRGGYVGGGAEHARLKNAINIHADCAYQSASYGLYQIMGFHAESLGFASAKQMVDHMSINEGNQLNVFVRFIMANASMHKALKAKKWADFARAYNGPAFKENFYDLKLAQAYAHHAQ